MSKRHWFYSWEDKRRANLGVLANEARGKIEMRHGEYSARSGHVKYSYRQQLAQRYVWSHDLGNFKSKEDAIAALQVWGIMQNNLEDFKEIQNEFKRE